MTDSTVFDLEPGSLREQPDYPRAKPSEELTGGVAFDDIMGAFPWEPDDGFEEAIRELRRAQWREGTQ
jgi:hypothetical protein